MLKERHLISRINSRLFVLGTSQDTQDKLKKWISLILELLCAPIELRTEIKYSHGIRPWMFDSQSLLLITFWNSRQFHFINFMVFEEFVDSGQNLTQYQRSTDQDRPKTLRNLRPTRTRTRNF